MARQIFISYSKKDAGFAFKLVESIEAHDHRIWIDREIGGGQQWRQTIEQTVHDSSEMIVIISKNSLASRWVQHESSMAYALGKKLIPIVIDSEALGDLDFAWMDEIQYIDFTKYSYEHALKLLIEALTPHNPLQDMLDQQLVAYRQTGDLMGEALLSLIEEGRDTLVVSKDAESLIDASSQALQFNRQLFRGGIGVVVLLAILALFFFGASIQSGRRAANSQATNLAVQTQIVRAKTEQAIVGIEATYAANQAAEQVATSRIEIQVAQTQMVELEQQRQFLEIKAAEAERKFMEAETALKEIFDDTGLVFVGNGPSDLLWDGSLLWVVNSEGNSIQAIDPSSGKLGSKIQVGVQPVDILSDGSFLWVANYFDDTISRIDPVTREIITYSTGDRPSALYFDGVSLWIANEYEDTVIKVDPMSGEILLSVAVDANPVSLAFDGTSLWVANYEGNSIQSISIADGAVSSPIPVSTGPFDLLWDGQSLWIASRAADRVDQFNPVSRRVINSIEVADGPTSLIYDGTNLWVANRGADAVQLINPVLGQVVSTYDVGDFPQALAWDGNKLWVANFDDDNVQLLDRAAGAVVVAIPVGENPRAMTLINNNLWIASQNDKLVQQIDLATNDVIASVQIGGRPTGIAFDGQGLWVSDFTNDRIVKVADLSGATPLFFQTYLDEPKATSNDSEDQSGNIEDAEETAIVYEVFVGNGPSDMVFGESSLWVANLFEDTVVEVDPTSLQVLQTITVDDGPYRLLYADDSLWVAHRTSGTIQRIDPETGELLFVFELGNSQPVDFLLDKGVLWVAIENEDVIKGFDIQSGEEIINIAVEEDPVGIAKYGGALWVINQDSDSLVKIDFETLSVIQRVPLGDGPSQLVIDSSGGIWITLARANAVQLVDGVFLDLLINFSD